MAELNTGGGGGGKGGKVRTKKMSTRVDLTAMVDLAFLLITFFMLTTTLSKPKAMDLTMPEKDKDKPEDVMKVDDRRTMNVLLGKNDKVEWYMGAPEEGKMGNPMTVGYGKNGIERFIIEQMKKVPEITGDPTKGVVVLIKPSDKSTYKNLVDLLDMCGILVSGNSNFRFAIVDITKPDIGLLEHDGNL